MYAGRLKNGNVPKRLNVFTSLLKYQTNSSDMYRTYLLLCCIVGKHTHHFSTLSCTCSFYCSWGYDSEQVWLCSGLEWYCSYGVPTGKAGFPVPVWQEHSQGAAIPALFVETVWSCLVLHTWSLPMDVKGCFCGWFMIQFMPWFCSSACYSLSSFLFRPYILRSTWFSLELSFVEHLTSHWWVPMGLLAPACNRLESAKQPRDLKNIWQKNLEPMKSLSLVVALCERPLMMRGREQVPMCDI